MEQLKDQMRILHLNILVDIENAVNAARSAFEKVGATREARIFAEAALAAEQKKLENGKSTSYFVLDFQRQFDLRRYEEIDALRQYNKLSPTCIVSRAPPSAQPHRRRVQVSISRAARNPVVPPRGADRGPSRR